eukprot:3651592-Amphidinium_carterae.1
MGMGSAAGWAQAATDVATNRAGLPRSSFTGSFRGCATAGPPVELPIRASILDDVWGMPLWKRRM